MTRRNPAIGYDFVMTATTKLLWAFGVISIALFVLASGRTNVRNFQEVQASAEEIYADRLVVKGLIFDLSNMLHDKELAQVTADASFYAEDNAAIDARLTAHIEQFRGTKLTGAESRALERFATHVSALQAAEREADLASGAPVAPADADRLATLMDDLEADLEELAAIQLQEGRRRMRIGDDAAADMIVVAWVEAAVMTVLAVLLIGVFVAPTRARQTA